MYRLHAVDDWASLIVHLVLADLGVPFTRVLREAEGPDRASAAFRALSPLGRIPALETPEGPMFETVAILLWLADRHGLAPTAGRPAFLSWMAFLGTTVHPAVMALVHPERPGGAAAAAALGPVAQAELRGHLGLIEAMLARAAPAWAAVGEPSVFTPYLGVLMRWAQAFPADADCAVRVAEFPGLRQLLSAYETRPAVKAAAAAEGLHGAFLTEAA